MLQGNTGEWPRVTGGVAFGQDDYPSSPKDQTQTPQRDPSPVCLLFVPQSGYCVIRRDGRGTGPTGTSWHPRKGFAIQESLEAGGL